jgi:hypothetical protein
VAWVSEASIDLAVLRLFRQRKGFSCGARCLYSELERRWRTTGLRRSDLRLAVERLRAASCLRVHEIGAGQDVELLLEGYRRLVPVLMSSGEWGLTVRAVLHLWRARVRVSAGSLREWNGVDSRRPSGD